jgi:hypothetical protein
MPKHLTNRAKRKDARLSEPLSPRLLPLKAGAEYLGLSVWAMRARIWAGQIPVVQFPGGRKMYLDVRDLDEFIEKHKRIIQ